TISADCVTSTGLKLTVFEIMMFASEIERAGKRPTANSGIPSLSKSEAIETIVLYANLQSGLIRNRPLIRNRCRGGRQIGSPLRLVIDAFGPFALRSARRHVLAEAA